MALPLLRLPPSSAERTQQGPAAPIGSAYRRQRSDKKIRLDREIKSPAERWACATGAVAPVPGQVAFSASFFAS